MLPHIRLLARKVIRRLANKRQTFVAPQPIDSSPDSYRRLSDEIDHLLREKLLAVWYPHCIDKTRGGYIQKFSSTWSSEDETNKFLVCQARLAWTAAVAAGYSAEIRAQYLDHALHGLTFLDRVMRDEEFGGFHWRLDADGKINAKFGDDKHVYGIAFVIYAGAEIFRQTQNDLGLRVALDAYRWLEDNAADHENGGYFEWLRRDGSYIPPPPQAHRDGRWYTLRTLVGFKSMNTHLHLLEAYTLLYQVWPDDDLRKRLEHILHIVRDRIAVAPGALNLYFTPDWRPVPAHDSFGHDVETAYLLTEAAAALGGAEDTLTSSVARQLVDHALIWGWDNTFGGFYDKGESFYRPHDTTKVGWVQAEGLNALLLMHARFGLENRAYFDAFSKQWHFIAQCQIDHHHGGWHTLLARDGQMIDNRRHENESGAIYHYARAMINSCRALRRLCEQ